MEKKHSTSEDKKFADLVSRVVDLNMMQNKNLNLSTQIGKLETQNQSLTKRNIHLEVTMEEMKQQMDQLLSKEAADGKLQKILSKR